MPPMDFDLVVCLFENQKVKIKKEQVLPYFWYNLSFWIGIFKKFKKILT